ncbi:F-box only protein 41 [Platysternon megacephalum]|uniref:F-box only protein 41 n=1 Tax=Platysternon megacephalum TaxID=55544 RepID=A0A4D9E6X8_9SAUR|nr:F-box only protein 41 [Platysternon megacephalum]
MSGCCEFGRPRQTPDPSEFPPRGQVVRWRLALKDTACSKTHPQPQRVPATGSSPCTAASRLPVTIRRPGEPRSPGPGTAGCAREREGKGKRRAVSLNAGG